MAEPIEQWIAEFESECGAMEVLDKSVNGNYISSETHHLWRGFLIAKRSMPVIVLPSQGLLRNDFQCGCNNGISWCEAAITAAGYQYRAEGSDLR